MKRSPILYIAAAAALQVLSCATPLRIRPTDSLEADLETLARAYRNQTGGAAVGILYVPPDGTRIRGYSGASPDAVYEIGSITKTFVAVVVLQLAEEGLFSLDDHPSEFGFDFPRAHEITLRSLLDHSAGLPDYTRHPSISADPGGLSRARSPEELLELGLSAQPDRDGWFYSNTHYILLGMIVERATGHSVEAQIRCRILEPLGMDRTFYRPTEPVPVPHVTGYYRSQDRFVDAWNSVHPSFFGCAGGMVSTADDLARFFGALFGGELLNPGSIADMTAFTPRPGGIEYGLGLFSFDRGGGPWIGHGGTTFGTECGAYRSGLDGGILVYFCALYDCGLPDLERGIADLLANHQGRSTTRAVQYGE